MKKAVNIKSVIRRGLEKISKAKTDEDIKRLFIETIKKSGIKEIDKKKMIMVITYKKGYYNIIKYVYDSLMKYEGEGAIKLK